VFVPRVRSELLVREAASRARLGTVIVDACCGTGAVGLAILAALGEAELHATESDPVAARCARRNLAGRGELHEGDML
jgi:release factor glutamine methyltransferase